MQPASVNPTRHVIRLALGLVALTVAAFVLVGDMGVPTDAPWRLQWWVLGLAFALAEMAAVEIRYSHETHTISPAEIPLVFGLTMATPAALLVGRVVGSFLALAFYREQRPLKLAFNVSLFAAETAIAVAVYRLWLGGASPNGPYGWLGAMLAVSIAVVTSAIMVDAVMALHDGRRSFSELVRSFSDRFADQRHHGVRWGWSPWVAVWRDPAALLLLAGLVGIFYSFMRAFGAMSRRHDDLLAVHEFTARVAGGGGRHSKWRRLLWTSVARCSASRSPTL